MATEFLLFQRFLNREAAREIVELLTTNGIEGRVEDEIPLSEGIVTFQSIPAALLLLRGNDFERARELLRRATEETAATVSTDHYLYGFADAELSEILAKPDEWSALDVALAQRLLRERGQGISPQIVEKLVKDRTQALAKPQEIAAGWLLFGYMTAGLGGLFGVLFGWYLVSSRKTLPTGQQVLAYSPKARRHGRIILVFGLIVLGVVLVRGFLTAPSPG
jgi:hypothetical protein